MDISKIKGTIEVDCRKCVNLKTDGCIPYGEDANIAVQKCSEDCFSAYVTYDEIEMKEGAE